jgi:hypothetical protein
MRRQEIEVPGQEASLTTEWLHAQRELAADLILCAQHNRSRAREAVTQAQRIRANVAARRAGLAPDTDGPRPCG